jgi:hypothetical protein
MLEKDPKKRITLDEMQKHKWMNMWKDKEKIQLDSDLLKRMKKFRYEHKFE